MTARQQLDNLAAALVDDVLALTDEEVLAEFIEDGGDPEQLVVEMRALFEQAVQKVRQDDEPGYYLGICDGCAQSLNECLCRV